MALLEVDGIRVAYQKVVALREVSMAVGERDFVTLIGSNGAGKSTTLRTISGLNHPEVGEIRFDGERIDRLSADKVVRLGIAQVPENRRVFKDLTVMENLMLGAYSRRDKAGIRESLETIFDYFPILKERARQHAKTMSGGEQQMMVIGRALMSRPRLLLLDEPSLGLAPIIVKKIAGILTRINAAGIAIVMVEQNAELALELANYAYVLETGRIALEGAAAQLMDDEHVRRAYLGM